MRFCLLTTFYPPWNFGGDGIQVQRLARALCARGHEVTVVHSAEGYEAMGGAAHPPSDRDGAVRLVAVRSRLGAASPVATYLTGRPVFARSAIAAAVGDEQFDVLHFHNPSLLGGPGVLRMGTGLKLYTAHEQWLVCPTHVLWQDNRRLCVEPHCLTCTLRHGRPPQLWRGTGLLKRSVAELDLLITPSATSLHLHRRFAEVVELAVLPHFVPDPGPPAAAPTDGRYVLFAGRLEPIKGADTLLPLARRLPEVRVVIAGTGSLEQELRDASAAVPNVEFLGWQDEAALDGLYRGALAALVPSPGHESFGLVAVEALSRGVPAIVRDFGALGELAASSDAILGYRTGEELVRTVAALAGAPDRRTHLGETARADYLRNFTERRHMQGYFELLRRGASARGDHALADRCVSAPRDLLPA